MGPGDQGLTGAEPLEAGDDAAVWALAERLRGARVLLFGPPGSGKSTLTRRLGAALAEQGLAPLCMGADPGSPGFGVPGALCLGEWRGGAWCLLGIEALCTLDAGRFRLPLVAAARRLAAMSHAAPLLLDGPGVVRGVAGAELLCGLVEAVGVTVVLSLVRTPPQPLLIATLRALGLPVLEVKAPPAARRPGKTRRARLRTALWDGYLERASPRSVDTALTPLLGTPPPLQATTQWPGRQAALLDHEGRTLALGEVLRVADGRVELHCPDPGAPWRALLVRDARRDSDGLLGSAGPDAVDAVRYAAPADVLPGAPEVTGPRPVVRAGVATAALVNGVLGDPLLHVRLQHRRRSLLFDLGEAGRLPARLAHQVSDVFLSHAHMDHVAGFLWLTRSRLGELPPLRVFGPAGIAGHLRGMLDGVLWDRIGTRGPRFTVTEFDGVRLRRIALRGGGPSQALGESDAAAGLLVDEPELRVRAATLDHGHGTRVLAFAMDTPRTLNVRRERLAASRLVPGPWLTRLKTLVAAGETATPVRLPDGREAPAAELARELLLEAPGVKIAYATDLADHEANRVALAHLAAGAHTLFCEASFRLRDGAQAARTGHLTTHACGAIAARAGVERLVPFHFSRRYEGELAAVYDELRAAFARTVTPPLRDGGDA